MFLVNDALRYKTTKKPIQPYNPTTDSDGIGAKEDVEFISYLDDFEISLL